jgi:hypothetical protein
VNVRAYVYKTSFLGTLNANTDQNKTGVTVLISDKAPQSKENDWR